MPHVPQRYFSLHARQKKLERYVGITVAKAEIEAKGVVRAKDVAAIDARIAAASANLVGACRI